MNSSNIVVKTITNMGIYGLHSVMGANKRFLQSKLYMEEMNVYEIWKQMITAVYTVIGIKHVNKIR